MNVTDRIVATVKASGVPDRKVRSTLAKLCGISPQAVKEWLDGKTKNIKHEHLIKIAGEYDVTIEWLLTGKKPRSALEAAQQGGKGKSSVPAITKEIGARFLSNGSAALKSERRELLPLLDEDTSRQIVIEFIGRLDREGRIAVAQAALTELPPGPGHDAA